MNREIKFRGMTNNGWVYGYYLAMQDDFGIATPTIYNLNTNKFIPVEEETVGQYTGIKDKNGNEIYEGDIFVSNNTHKYKVIYDDTRFIGINNIGVCYVDSCYKDGSSRIKVIGNIYENKELLKDEYRKSKYENS